jgi:hypothetical protein
MEESMRKLYVSVLLVLFFALVALPTVAQEGPDILEVENGMIMGYNFDPVVDDVAQTQRFGVNFNLSDSFDVGFLFQQAGTNYAGAASFLVLKYTLADAINVGIMYGNFGTPASGLMFSYALLSNDVQGISTNLNVSMEYMLPDITAPVDQGIFGVSLNFGFGI